uniref:Col_cuticle_N domain-containing protein n=1 Tax=Caenorhabditis tropicalis TaxID=1561998 RepID=A0A1I7TBD8_9PELO
MNLQKTANFEALQSAGAEYELTDVEIQQLKEHNQKRVKRVVGFVAIAMTLLSLALVAFSLALGRKIDLMVEQKVEQRMEIYTAHGINLTETRS